MKKDISPELLKKYLEGACSPEEEAIVDNWYQSFDLGKDQGQEISGAEEEFLERKILAQIKSRIGQSPEKETIKLPTGNERTRSFWVYGVAAAAIVLISVGLYFYFMPDKHPIEKIAVASTHNNTKVIARHLLSDGTVVWLKPHTRIDYPVHFSDTSRTLWLDGEAFFEVAKDKKRPFRIRTGNIVTQVVGTSFNIKAYGSSSSIEVSVMTGKVSVSSASKSVLLIPHERVTYLKRENLLQKENQLRLPALDMWQSMTVSFDNAPVRDVVKSLSEKFNTTFKIQNKNLLNCSIRADFTNQNLPDILDILSRSIEASYELQGDTILLKGEGCLVN